MTVSCWPGNTTLDRTVDIVSNLSTWLNAPALCRRTAPLKYLRCAFHWRIARAGKVRHRHCAGSRLLEGSGGVGKGRPIVPLDEVGIDLYLEGFGLNRLVWTDIVELLSPLS